MRVLLSLLITVFGWSSAFIFIPVAMRDLSPLMVSLMRYLVAAVIFLGVYGYLPNKKPLKLLDRLQAMSCGAIGMGIYSLAVSIGELSVPASITGFIIGLMPLCSSVLAAFLYKEALSKRAITGIFTSMFGLGLIAFSGHQKASFERGILWLVIAVVAATAYTLIQKPVIKKMNPMQFIAHAIWGGALVLLLGQLLSPESFFEQLQLAPKQAIYAVIYLGLVPSILSFSGWSYAISQINVARAGLALYTMPIVTAILAFFILGEKPTISAFYGMLLAFLGSVIGSVKLPQKKKELASVTKLRSEA